MQQTITTPKKATIVPKEVEIKIKTTKKNMELLKLWLDQNAKFQGTEQHKEVYLDNPNKTFFFTKPNGERDALKYLRIRWSNENGSVCLKNWHQDEQGNTTYCDEYETNVASPKTLLLLLEQLGFTDQTWMEKKRKKFLVGVYEIVIDEVKNLGTFVEIEIKQQVADPKSALKNLETFLVQTIGIKEFWLQTRGYISQLRNPEINVSKYKKYTN